MSVQYSVGVRDGQANAKETEWITGGAPVLKIFSGNQPANCAAANSGTELASMNLPADPLTASSSGNKTKSGTWSGTAIATGTAGHYRVYKNDGTTCVEQGDITDDMTIDNTSIATGQTVTVTSYSMTIAHA